MSKVVRLNARTGRRKNQIAGQFSARLIEMLESPAHRVLSLSARRVLDRLEIEHAHHGGHDNGKLPVTFDQFQEFGIDRHAIAPGMRECMALGFVEITERGIAGNADFRKPNLFRLTYRHTEIEPTEDWRKIQTIEEAETIARAARKAAAEKQKSSGGKSPPRWGKPPLKTAIPSGGNPHYGHSGETPTTSISRDPQDASTPCRDPSPHSSARPHALDSARPRHS
jgi:hypothetical protein